MTDKTQYLILILLLLAGCDRHEDYKTIANSCIDQLTADGRDYRMIISDLRTENTLLRSKLPYCQPAPMDIP